MLVLCRLETATPETSGTSLACPDEPTQLLAPARAARSCVLTVRDGARSGLSSTPVECESYRTDRPAWTGTAYAP